MAAIHITSITNLLKVTVTIVESAYGENSNTPSYEKLLSSHQKTQGFLYPEDKPSLDFSRNCSLNKGYTLHYSGGSCYFGRKSFSCIHRCSDIGQKKIGQTMTNVKQKSQKNFTSFFLQKLPKSFIHPVQIELSDFEKKKIG